MTFKRAGQVTTNTSVNGRTWELVRDYAPSVNRAVFSAGRTGVNLVVRGTDGSEHARFVQQQRVGAGFFGVLGIPPLVAVGTHKVGYFHGHALGSRSIQLAAVASAPSAVVPVTSWRGRSGVAVGISDGADSDDAVRFAAREASRLGEPLVLLRAAGGEQDSVDADAGERAASIAAGEQIDLPIEVRSTADPASGALIGVSRRAVLTVTGRRVPSRGFLPLGRTNTDLLMNLAGPVVVVPHRSVEAVVVGWTAA